MGYFEWPEGGLVIVAHDNMQVLVHFNKKKYLEYRTSGAKAVTNISSTQSGGVNNSHSAASI